MEETILSGELRAIVGKQVKALRRAGRLPAVIYGRGLDPISISLDAHNTSRTLPGLSSSHLIVIDIGGEKHTTLVREKQRHPVSGKILHIDFLEVSMTERLKTEVQIVLFGESPAAKNFNGVIVSNLENVEVEALPGNLPERISIDISVLKNIGDSVHVRDIVVSSEVEILTDPNEIVVLVMAPAVEVETVSAVAETIEPEVVERGRKEEES
jgi:large subunit ribosomal protein L25